MVVADEQAPQLRPSRRGRDLDQVGGLLGEIVRTHRSLKERPRRSRPSEALVDP
jgi:hypothetical protein